MAAELPPRPADPFARLRSATPARIGLGRAGAGLPTAPMLAFQSAHAQARDAVWTALDAEALARALPGPAIVLDSAAHDRATYLRRPDLGRRLSDPGALPQRGAHDVALVIADGLSAGAAQTFAPEVVRALMRRLAAWRFAPLIIVRQGRVAIGDEIGAALGAAAVVVLLGERPGLSAPESLGAYVTWSPRVGRRDAERNCVSNIRREGGLPCEAAAATIAWLLTEARRMGFTGVDLKDRQSRGSLPAATGTLGVPNHAEPDASD
ncbi:MAG TPA: ethanolamine ammonia-lyase subunit EutC [Caulobacteraceae bacterium]|jgi:ethanolamine ammonia-lyase small subunit|nr:ethanolamine ammonia-lyase subunit EutC [Caulobacteraceae bacterium]